jgi:hypothetical protein
MYINRLFKNVTITTNTLVVDYKINLFCQNDYIDYTTSRYLTPFVETFLEFIYVCYITCRYEYNRK